MQLVIMRSYIEVPQSSAGLFELLGSAEGAKILDDTTNHTDAPLEILHWQDRHVPLLSLPVLVAKGPGLRSRGGCPCASPSDKTRVVVFEPSQMSPCHCSSLVSVPVMWRNRRGAYSCSNKQGRLLCLSSGFWAT